MQGKNMKGITNSDTYAIGEMSTRTGVNIETVRYYEKIGMMSKPKRTEGGNRLYNNEQLQRRRMLRNIISLLSQRRMPLLQNFVFIDQVQLPSLQVNNIYNATIRWATNR